MPDIPLFLVFAGFGFAWNRCFYTFCCFFFLAESGPLSITSPSKNFSYLHVLFLERVEELRTTDVTSEPPRIEGLLTAPASVPGVPPFPLARGLPLKAYQQELRRGPEALSQHGLDMRPPLFVLLLSQGGTVSLHVPFQATSEALSDTPLFLLLASALVLLPFSFDSILCCSFESSGRRRWWA